MQNQEWWDGLLATIKDAVIVCDGAGLIQYMNTAAASLCGWTKSEKTNRPLTEVFHIVHEQSRIPVENPIDRAFRERSVVELPSDSLLTHSGSKDEIQIEGSASPILDADSRLLGVGLVFRDTTPEKEFNLLKAKLAAIVESSDDIIVSKTLDGFITSWNQGAQKVLGYTAKEIVGHHVSLLMPPDHLEDTKKILEKIRRGEMVDHYLTKRRCKDGTIIDVSLTVSPIRNKDGEIVGASKVGRDITAALQASLVKERLAAIVESSDDIIVSKTLDGIITSWNKGAEKILGYSPEEVIGRHVSMLMPPEVLEDTDKILGKVRGGERVDHYETRRRRKDGTIIDVSLTVSPIRDADGNIVGASKIGRDISQQKVIEAARQEADRRKDEFLAMLAHELRNPIASISNAAQLFGKLETEADLEWAKDVINRQVTHLSRLIDDLLDVSRITRGKISLRKEPLNLSPIVSSAIETVRPLVEERKHEMVVSLAPGALRLEGDPVRLEQILVNVLTNAAKYTEAGGRISLAAKHDQGHIVIKVRDTGIGISAELLPRVFELFTQGDRSNARSEGGLGIGLTLVQKLTEMHGGTVTVESEGLGKGSEFALCFPAASENTVPTPQPKQDLPHLARQSWRILVVDDNRDTAVGIAKLLKLLGHDVIVAHDGESAIEAARTHRPEIMLLDIGLPRMDGYQVVKKLRQEACCKTSLIIAVSGYGQEEDRRKSQEAGFDHHLVKPVDFDILLSLFTTPTLEL